MLNAGGFSDALESGDHSDNSSEQADHGGDTTDIIEVGDAVVELGGLTRPLRFGYLANLIKAGSRVLGGKVERLVDNPGDTLVLAVTDGDQAELVLFANEGVSGVHELIADNGALPDREEVENDQDDREK